MGAGTLTAGHSYSYELIFDDVVGRGSFVARSDVRTVGYFTVPNSVPEPGAAALLLGGLGLAAMARTRRKS